MKLSNYIKLLLTGILFTACSSDPVDGPGQPDKPGVTTPAESGVFTLFTRATNDNNDLIGDVTNSNYGKIDGTHDNELIHNWVVFFVNTNGNKVDYVASGDGTASSATDVAGKDYQFKIAEGTNLTGTYDIIAFANIPETTVISTLLGISDAANYAACVGKNVTLSSVQAKSYNIVNNGYAVGTDLIPMSGFRAGVEINDNNATSEYQYKDYHKDATGHTAPTTNLIEVIRMAAKVELKILNSSSSDITITDISFGILNKGNVPLLPNYEILGGEHHDKGSDGDKPTIPAISATDLSGLQAAAEVIHLGSKQSESSESSENSENSATTFTINTVKLADLATYGGKTAISTGDAVVKNAVQNYIFYVRESLASVTHPASNHFMVTVKFRRGTDAKEEELHFSPTDRLEWINRNDHIIIPIRITDVTVDWEVLFYPPIGGYPAEIDNKDEFNYYCEFGTQGDFQIKPTIYTTSGTPLAAKCVATEDELTDANAPCYSMTIKDETGNLKIKEFDLGGNEKTGTIGADGKPTTSSIFSKLPTVNAKDGDIIGTLNSNTGRAVMTVTLKIKTSTATVETRTRNIYILRSK